MGGNTSKHQKDELKSQVQVYNDELQRALIGCGQARKTFTTLSDLWCETRKDTIDTMTEIADIIEQHHRNANIANLGGASSCIAGGTAGIASIVLAPFSGGASLALAAGGIVGTVAGSATVLAANLIEAYLTKELMEKVQRALDADALYTKALRAAFKEVIIHENEVIRIMGKLQADYLKQTLGRFTDVPRGSDPKFDSTNQVASIEHLITLVSCFFQDDDDFLQQLKKTLNLVKTETPSISAAVPTSSDFFQALKEVSSVGPETLKRIGEAAFQSSAVSMHAASVGAQVMAIGLGAIFVVLDIYHFAKTSKNFDEGSRTELTEKIRNSVLGLQKELEQVNFLKAFFEQAL